MGIFKKISFGVAANIYPSALAFIFVPLLTFALSPSEFGVLTYASSIIAFITALLSLGLNSYVMKTFEYRNFQRTNFQVFCTAFWLACFSALFFSLLIFFFLSKYGLYSSVDFSSLAIYIAMIVFCACTVLVPQAFLILRGQMAELFWLIFLATSVEYILIYCLVLDRGLAVEGKLLSRLLAASLLFLALIGLFRKLLLRPKFSFSAAKSALRFGSTFAVASVLYLLIDLSDKVILEAYGSLDDLGFYGIGLGIAFVLMSLSRGINLAMQAPLISAAKANSPDALIDELTSSQKTLNALMFVAANFLVLVTVILTDWIFDSSYSISGIYAVLLIPIPIFYAHQNLYTAALVARGEKSFYLKSAIAAVVANIILDLILVPSLGVYGCIMATYVAYVTMLTINYLSLKSKVKVLPFSTDFYSYLATLSLFIAAVCLDLLTSVGAIALAAALSVTVSFLVAGGTRQRVI